MTNQEIIKKFENYLRARTYAENTKNSYIRNIKEFLDIVGVSFDILDDEHKIIYDEYLDNQAYSLTTCNVKISSVITFLKFLHVKNIYKNDLYTMFELKRNANANSNPHKVPTLQEMRKIEEYVSSLKYSFMNQRKKLIFLLFLHTGIRRDEMTNLKWSNVKYDEEKIYLDKAKRSEFRNVWINEQIISTLKWWKRLCEEKGLDSDYIIINGKNKPMGNRELNDLVKRTMSHLDMGYTPHCLRKGCATMMALNYELEEIQTLLGHSSRAVTELYVKPTHEKNMAKNNFLTKKM